jgi:hypothetical protein
LVGCFVAIKRSHCCHAGFETQAWFDSPLDAAMIVFDDVVEVLDRT